MKINLKINLEVIRKRRDRDNEEYESLKNKTITYAYQRIQSITTYGIDSLLYKCSS